MNSEVSHFMLCVTNFERYVGLQVAFNNCFRLEIITDTDNKVKLCVIMNLLAKTIIMLPKINLNNKRLPHNIELMAPLVINILYACIIRDLQKL